jgi:diguanylate cyclase (GGDEF)-like protein
MDEVNRLDAKLHDEAGRLAALQRYEILDTGKEDAFERITGLVKAVLSVPMCAVSLIDGDRQWFKSCIGMPAQETARDISFCTHTIQHRKPLHVRDALLDPLFQNNPLVTGSPYIRSYLGVPLSTPDGYNVGSLCAIDTAARDYSPEQIAILQSFAALVIDELELRRLAQTDHLTGASTRRSFCLELEKVIARYKRAGTPAAMLLLDIDHFKRVNDTYGHTSGDLVLQMVAEQLASQLRPTDVLGRLGGEEFGILLPATERAAAAKVAERFRALLESVAVMHDPPLHVTASFGVAMVGPRTLSTREWIADADKALYEAKRSGRNRCCLAASCEEPV